MCNLALAGLALGAGSSALQFAGQRQQARQQRQFQQRAAQAERQRALMEKRSLAMRQTQQKEATAREIGEIGRRAEEARATTRVSAGQAGVAGLSVDALLNQYIADEAALRMGAIRQQEMRDLQAGLAFTDAEMRTRNRLIDINRPIRSPSFAAGAIDVVSSGLSGYRGGLQLKRELETPKIT